MRLRAYICSPLRGRCGSSVERNCRIADRLALLAIAAGYAPFVPHYLAAVLDDSNPRDRVLGIECGTSMLAVCNELLVWKGMGVSGGMASEIQDAEDCYGIRIRDVTEWLAVLPVPHELPAGVGRPAGSCWRGCLTLKDCEGSR